MPGAVPACQCDEIGQYSVQCACAHAPRCIVYRALCMLHGVCCTLHVACCTAHAIRCVARCMGSPWKARGLRARAAHDLSAAVLHGGASAQALLARGPSTADDRAGFPPAPSSELIVLTLHAPFGFVAHTVHRSMPRSLQTSECTTAAGRDPGCPGHHGVALQQLQYDMATERFRVIAVAMIVANAAACLIITGFVRAVQPCRLCLWSGTRKSLATAANDTRAVELVGRLVNGTG